MVVDRHRLVLGLLLLWIVPAATVRSCPAPAAIAHGHVLSEQGHEVRLFRQIVRTIEQRNGEAVESPALARQFVACLQQLQGSCTRSEARPCAERLMEIDARVAGRYLVVTTGGGQQRLSTSGSAWRLARRVTAACCRRLAGGERQQLSDQLWYLWIEATLTRYGQPHDRYTYSDELARRQAERRGKSFVPGLAVSIDGDQVLVREIVDPALAAAGLQIGDRLFDLDAEPLPARLHQVWTRPGPSPYTLTVLPAGQQGGGKRLGARRVPIRHATLHWQRWRGLVYARLDWFARNTISELRRMARALASEPVQGLILDLRANSGGRVSLDVVDCFLKPGQMVASVREGPDGERVDIDATVEYFDWPLVLLIDADTASMAEVLAAAIHQHGRGMLVGEPTVGKGVGQTIHPIGDEGELALTDSRYFYPGTDDTWQGTGISPDLAVVPDDGEQESLHELLEEPVLDLDRQLTIDRALQRARAVLQPSEQRSDE